MGKFQPKHLGFFCISELKGEVSLFKILEIVQVGMVFERSIEVHEAIVELDLEEEGEAF